MWYIYILETNDGRYYTGSTNDINRRIKAHQEGKGAKFTRSFGVHKLLYTEKFRSKSNALKREKQIQSFSKIQKIQLIEGREIHAKKD